MKYNKYCISVNVLFSFIFQIFPLIFPEIQNVNIVESNTSQSFNYCRYGFHFSFLPKIGSPNLDIVFHSDPDDESNHQWYILSLHP